MPIIFVNRGGFRQALNAGFRANLEHESWQGLERSQGTAYPNPSFYE